MTFPGLRQRPAMQYSYVEWSKVKLSIIHKLIWWIGSEELMHKGISPTPLPMLLKISKNPKQPSPCLAISTIKDLVIFQRLMKRKGCFSKGGKNFAHAENECRSKNKHAKKRLKLGGDCHSTKQFASRYIWSSNIDRKTRSQEFSVDTTTLFTWFTKGNAFANIRNGRSYAQVTAQKKLLPVSAACIRKTPDRNANSMKKVHNFPQRPKVSALKMAFLHRYDLQLHVLLVLPVQGRNKHMRITSLSPNINLMSNPLL